MFKIAEEESNIGFNPDEAEIINLINDTKDYIANHFKIVEKNLKRIFKEGYFAGYSEIVKNFSQFISKKLENIKNIFILQVQEVKCSPCSVHAAKVKELQWKTCSVHAAKVKELRDIITSRINEIAGRINLARVIRDFEEIWEHVECNVSILNFIKAELLERLDKLNCLFEDL